jgi:hypothetical protein
MHLQECSLLISDLHQPEGSSVKNTTIGSYSVAKVGGPEIYCKKNDFVS